MEKIIPITYFAKCYFDICHTMIDINAYVTLYMSEKDAFLDNNREVLKEIWTKLSKETTYLTDLFPIDKRFFKNALYFDEDDSYENVIVDDSFITPNQNYNDSKFLYGGYVDINIDNKTYSVAITVTRDLFENEEP